MRLVAYGWAGTASQLIAEDQDALRHALSEAQRAHFLDVPGSEQDRAWSTELRWLSASLHSIPDASTWGVVLEYELPMEGGRRPDAVVLARDNVLVLEFKETDHPGPAEIDQVRGYARDLLDYHSECRNRVVKPFLVLPNRPGRCEDVDDACVIGADNLPRVLRAFAGPDGQIPVDDWVEGEYVPIPTLVEAARRIFRDEPLPAIKRAESAGIPRLLRWLHALVATAKERRERHLVLIAGVPGSGKTLVGLQFVHESGDAGVADALFLSGNDPLVAVLQNALGNRVFVRRMHDFVLEYGVRARLLPRQHVLVFDEAQRAWDKDRMWLRKQHPRSEPEILLDLAARLPDWGVVIGLVGEGQEIYLGEEAGLGQWAEALSRAPTQFRIHAPLHLAGAFEGHDVTVDPRLSLTMSLRTHRAERSQEWVAAFIDGRFADASAIAPDLRTLGFDVYVTTDLLAAKRYLVMRYGDAGDAKWGLLASSKAGNLAALGIDNTYRAMQRVDVPAWFNADTSDARSCCQLATPVTEFDCQGLELDMPLVCWGDDLGLVAGQWTSFRQVRNARNSHQLRLNSYRVLLSRGRDGAVIWVPPDLRTGQQDAVLNAFLDSGAKELGRRPVQEPQASLGLTAAGAERSPEAPALSPVPATRAAPIAARGPRLLDLGTRLGTDSDGHPVLHLRRGDLVERRELHRRRVGGNWQSGISYPRNGAYVLLFSGGRGDSEFGYHDQWIGPETLRYYGEWSGSGDMTLSRGNLRIVERSPELHVFTQHGRGFLFEGRFRYLDHDWVDAHEHGIAARAIVFRLQRVADSGVFQL